MSNILTVNDLTIRFSTRSDSITAVEKLNFNVEKEDIFGIVGESGSGKSVTALSVLGLLSENAIIDSGRIIYEEKDILKLNEDDMRKIRGKKISMIFQDPMTSLNPVFKIGDQIKDVLLRHEKMSSNCAKSRVIQLLKDVGVPDPVKRYNSYPHEFSGGMRQRVMIAMAIACNPEVLIADEPTTALDVSTQRDILKLLLQVKKQYDMTIIIITHDLGIIANLCNRMIVMRNGKKIEEGDVLTVFENPKSPYTLELLNSLPKNLNAQKLVGGVYDG